MRKKSHPFILSFQTSRALRGALCAALCLITLCCSSPKHKVTTIPMTELTEAGAKVKLFHRISEADRARIEEIGRVTCRSSHSSNLNDVREDCLRQLKNNAGALSGEFIEIDEAKEKLTRIDKGLQLPPLLIQEAIVHRFKRPN